MAAGFRGALKERAAGGDFVDCGRSGWVGGLGVSTPALFQGNLAGHTYISRVTRSIYPRRPCKYQEAASKQQIMIF
jgi:hypothetical protein